MSSGIQGRTTEYRWPVIDTSEPPGIRTVRGHITILVYETEAVAHISRRVVFSDAEGRPLPSIAIEDMRMFYDAAHAALKEMDLLSVLGPPMPTTTAGDIIR